jgi:hypothetical protein
MFSVGDQLPPEHRLNKTLGTIEYGLRQIAARRSIHALTIARGRGVLLGAQCHACGRLRCDRRVGMELNDGNLVALGIAGLIAFGGMVAKYVREVIRGHEPVPSVAAVVMLIPVVTGVTLAGLSMIWRLEHFMAYGMLTMSAGPLFGTAALIIRQGAREVFRAAKRVPVLLYGAGAFAWLMLVLYGIGD